MARRHPLADLLGEGVVTGLTIYAAWRWVFRPIGRLIGRLSWRWRRVLAPLWVATVLEIVALIWRALAPDLWPVALALPAAGLALALAGPHLSRGVARVVTALVPDSMDSGRKGVLDRPTERIYLALVLIFIGGWLALRVGAGASQWTAYGWQGGTVVFGGTWWYHRRIRIAGRADRYARKWRKLAEGATTNTKLKPLLDSKVVGATGTRRGLCTLIVRLAHGATLEDVANCLPNITSFYRLRRGAVSLAEDDTNSSRITLQFMVRDPWRGALSHPMPAPGSISLAGLGKRIQIGLYATGAAVMWTLQHLLVVGQTGSGKSTLLESLLIWLTACRDVVLVGSDMASGATLGVWRRCFALPLAEDYDSTVIMLQRLMAVIEDREKRLGQAKEATDDAGDSIEPAPEHPWLVAIIDEYPDWVAVAAARSTREYNYVGREHQALVGRIGKRGRKVGVWLILLAQNGSRADTGSKELQSQLKATIGLRLNQHANKVLWKEQVRQGWSCTGLRPGQFVLQDDEHNTPETAKGYRVSVRDRRAHIDAVLADGMRVLEPSAWAALTDTTDEVMAAGMVVPAPVRPDNPILAALMAGPANAQELAERAGVARATAFRHLRKLAAAGHAHSREGTWHAGPAPDRQPAA